MAETVSKLRSRSKWVDLDSPLIQSLNYNLFTASYDDYSCQNLTKKMPAGVFATPPLNRVKGFKGI